jgi:hypothetical protein
LRKEKEGRGREKQMKVRIMVIFVGKIFDWERAPRGISGLANKVLFPFLLLPFLPPCLSFFHPFFPFFRWGLMI